jgi:ribonuclease P protein component
MKNEKDVSAKQHKKKKNAWVQTENENQSRKSIVKQKTSKGEEKIKCLRDYSFPKQLRIRKRSEFKNVYISGTKFTTKNFIIFICSNNFQYPRLGITATKKYGKAVKRNRIKRMIREFFRLNKPFFKNGYDYVFLVKNNCTLTKFQEIVFELESFLKNEKIYNFSN